jgi:CO/xanthine dehydrogenase Mo-binding subunit
MDLASVELGIDPVELRRRNFLAPADPFTTLTGALRQRRLRQRCRKRCASQHDDLRAEQAARQKQ